MTSSNRHPEGTKAVAPAAGQRLAQDQFTSRRIVGLLLLVLAVFAGDRLLAAGIEQVLAQSPFRFSRLYFDRLTADVLIVGNSRGVNCLYAPAVEERLGLSAMNLSYNGLSPEIAEALVLDYYDRHPAPKFLVLELSNANVKGNPVGLMAPYVGASQRLTDLMAVERPKLATSLSVSHLLRYNSELAMRAGYYVTRETDQTWINRHQISDDVIAATQALKPLKLALPKRNLESIARVIKVAEGKGTTVVLLVAPYWPQYLAKIENHTRWLTRLREGLGRKVSDFSGALVDRRAFADRIHLNDQGSAMLLELLVAQGLLEHRARP